MTKERDLAIIRTMRILVTQGRNSETDQQLAERALSLAELYHGGALMNDIKIGVMTALDFYSCLSERAIIMTKFFLITSKDVTKLKAITKNTILKLADN